MRNTSPLQGIRCDIWLIEISRLRVTSDEKTTTPGVAETPKIYIAVEFRWLIVPIISVILALLFLLATMSESARRGIPAWRMSQIKPLLSLDQSAAEVLSPSPPPEMTIGPPENRAKELKLRLKQGDDQQWRLFI